MYLNHSRSAQRSHELQIEKEKTTQEQEKSACVRGQLEIEKEISARESRNNESQQKLSAREREKIDRQLEIEKEISARQYKNNKSQLEIEKLKRDRAEAEMQAQKSKSEADMEIAKLESQRLNVKPNQKKFWQLQAGARVKAGN